MRLKRYVIRLPFWGCPQFGWHVPWSLGNGWRPVRLPAPVRQRLRITSKPADKPLEFPNV